MKMPSLSPSEVRTVSIAGTAIVLGLAYVFAIKPYRADLSDAQMALQSERDNLVKEQKLVAASKNNPALIQAVDSAMKAFAPRLFDAGGGGELAAAADLSTYVEAIARDNHVFISGSSTEKPIVSPTGVRTLRAEFHAESDLRGVLSFLESLDHGDRMVTVEHIEIQHPASSSSDVGDVETLTLTVVVNGFMVGNPPAPAAAAGRGGSPGRAGG